MNENLLKLQQACIIKYHHFGKYTQIFLKDFIKYLNKHDKYLIDDYDILWKKHKHFFGGLVVDKYDKIILGVDIEAYKRPRLIKGTKNKWELISTLDIEYFKPDSFKDLYNSILLNYGIKPKYNLNDKQIIKAMQKITQRDGFGLLTRSNYMEYKTQKTIVQCK